ncbi:unnamed protein product [Cylindrotheca closterium]|uniref:Uncharacterized protein n=1 Tax=Cylindrotheca closterium TaxID=2856 RepID=A0AAD2G3V4_9STRA|nr:unnamed protein product [Cylindrotheca closterium]
MMKIVGWNPGHFSGRRKTLKRNNNKKSSIGLMTIVSSGFMVLGVLYGLFLLSLPSSMGRWNGHLAISAAEAETNKIFATPSDTCQYRKYPPRRYYDLLLEESSLPSFLEVEYIYGELPQLLIDHGHHSKNANKKLCVNQSEWQNNSANDDRLPFADGTNPSLLKIKKDLAISALLPKEAYYLATICMTNSQCAWKDTREEQLAYKISTQKDPSTVRTVLLVLNENFETLAEATITTIMDAPTFGKQRIQQPNAKQQEIYSLDDARLFYHKDEIWVSYREGRIFGYDKQVLNKVHITSSSSSSSSSSNVLQVTLQASEVETLCCGRNMALMENVRTQELQALTWVDPVTVENVPLKLEQQYHRRLTAVKNNKNNNKNQKKSHFHGTNGFMVHLPHTNEFLGIGHFHRPPSRDFDNEYARFGHHYTHAFFTISDEAPFRLTRLSPELLLPSAANPKDAEIIQFWSGLELVDDKTLTLAYGINDCEGAARYLSMSTVNDLLRPVPQGMEVVDLMKPMKLMISQH